MTKIHVGNASGSVIVGKSVNNSTISARSEAKDSEIFSNLKDALAELENIKVRESLIEKTEQMEKSAGTPKYATHYKEFMSLAADHLTVVAPFMAGLLSYLA